MEFFIIPDTDIVAVNRGKSKNQACSIIYRDKLAVLHEIDFQTCAQNYKSENNSASAYCIGERNIVEKYFIFYTSGIKTKVIFKKNYVINLFTHHLLKGSKTSRFQNLQRLITETYYTTYDLS